MTRALKTHLPLRQARRAPGGVQLTLCGRAVDCDDVPYVPAKMVEVTCRRCRKAAASIRLSDWLFTPEPRKEAAGGT